MNTYENYVANINQWTQEYFDEKGLYRQSKASGADQGDSCHHTHEFWIGVTLREQLLGDVKLRGAVIAAGLRPNITQYFFRDGKLVRHPDTSKWYSDPANFSRDQMVPTQVYLGVRNHQGTLEETLLEQLTSGVVLYPNTKMNYTNAKKSILKGQLPDVLTPTCLARILRATFGHSNRAMQLLLKPFLFVLDGFLVLNSLSQDLIYARQGQDYVDDNNHVIMLLQSRAVMPTSMGKLASYLYFKLRPRNLGRALAESDSVGEDEGLRNSYAAFLHYWRPESGDMLEMAYVYKPLLQWLYKDAH